VNNLSVYQQAVRENKQREAKNGLGYRRAERGNWDKIFKDGFIPWRMFEEITQGCEIQTGECFGKLKKEQWCSVSHSAYNAVKSLMWHQQNNEEKARLSGHWRKKLSAKQIGMFQRIYKEWEDAPLEKIRASQTPVEGWDYVADYTGDKSDFGRGFEPNLTSESWRDV